MTYQTSTKGKRCAVRLTPYLLIGSATIYLLVFIGVPLLQGARLSFTDTRLLNPSAGRWVGVDNYARLLTDGQFLGSIATTLLYTVLTVAATMFLGSVSAFTINHTFPGRAVARSLMVFPWAVPTVAVALVFRWIYNDNSGVANSALKTLGIGQVGWLTNPDFGLLSVIIATVWKISPFVMLVVLASLQSVPLELYEAAKVDGANPWKSFTTVTLPYILPTLKTVALLMTIWSFRRFEIIWLLTGGGPADATNTIVINVYRQAFNNSRLGFAAAIGMIGLLMSVVITVTYFIVEARTERKETRA